MEIIPLDLLPLGACAVVQSVGHEDTALERLSDLGLIPGTGIETVLTGPSGDPRAYLFRGAVIALRNGDARNISVCPVAAAYK